MRRTAAGLAILTLATVSVAQEPAPSVPDPVATDAADTARINAEGQARATAQSAAIRKAQEDYAKEQAAFAAARAAYEDAKRRNDAERAEAAASAAAYQRSLTEWKAAVAGINARNDRLSRPATDKEVTVVAPSAARRVCTTERATGTQIPRRVCRSQTMIREERAAGAAQVQDVREGMMGGTGCQALDRC